MKTYIEYTLRHPFQFYFRDQVLSQIALLAGRVKGVRWGFQFYNNRRPEEIPAHMENLYKALDDFGLPRWLYYYYDYWLACEYACLFLYRRLPDKLFGDRMAAADQIFVKVFNRYRDNYRQKAEAYERHFTEAGIRAPMHEVLDDPSALVGLRSMSRVFIQANPEAGSRYAEFLNNEMIVDVVR